MQNAADNMMTWLLGQSELLGLTVQNWMLFIAGALLLYIAVLVIGHRQPN